MVIDYKKKYLKYKNKYAQSKMKRGGSNGVGELGDHGRAAAR